MIVVENISHTFINKGNSIKVIEGFSATINEGEVIAILGPSGSGKSTILRCISGLLKPTSGTITINNQLPETALKDKQIGFAFQESALLEWKTVEENIVLPSTIGDRNVITKEQIEELISLVNLKGFEEFYPYQLSGGMKQRVSLARALLLQPTLLLLDEPFGSLDLLTRSNLIVELNRIMNEKKTPTIMVTHSIEEAVFLADKVLILSQRPCRVVAEIIPDLGKEKRFELFDDSRFLSIVAECRKTLLSHWHNEK